MKVSSALQASQVVLVVKNPPANAGDLTDVGLIPGLEDPLEKSMATHSSILAWRIPQTDELGGYRAWGRRVTPSHRGFSFLLFAQFKSAKLPL